MVTGLAADDAGMPGPARRPPGGAVPVSVPLNLTLVRRPGLVVRVTAASAYPDGFLFLLSVGFDIQRIPFERVDFYAPNELRYPLPARLEMRFPDGRMADSFAKLPGRRLDGAVMSYIGGMPSPLHARGAGPRERFRRHETSWWVSPLPPPGPVELAVYLRDCPELAGTGAFDADLIRQAARRCEVQWGTGGGGR